MSKYIITLLFIFNVLQQIWARFSFFYFKSREISLEISLIISYYLPVMFNFVTIIFDAFKAIYTTHKSCVILFLAILAL